MSDYTAVDQLKKRLDALRPIDAEKLRAIQEKFRLEWTYHTNALEGNPLTLSETSFFIREGLTSSGKPLSAYLEAGNHVEALDYLDSVVKDKTPISAFVIRQYHSMLFKKIDKIVLGTGTNKREIPITGGQYKPENNHVIRLDGQILQFTDHSQVPAEVDELVAWFHNEGSSLHPVEAASTFHHRLVRIHPFLDGNGRVSRLIMNTILMQHGYTPAIIPVEEKRRYLESLQSADDGASAQLFDFIEQQVSHTLQLTLDVSEGREAFDFADLSRLVKNIAEHTRNIEQDLGAATVTPEERSRATALKINQHLKALLVKHVQDVGQANIEGLGVSIQEPVQIYASPLQSQVQGIANGLAAQAFAISVAGGKRFTPNGLASFYVMCGRLRVVLVASVMLSRLNQKNQDAGPIFEPQLSGFQEGSIFLEDWNMESVNEFALAIMKRFYIAWNAEMERRKLLIAADEEEVQKSRVRG